MQTLSSFLQNAQISDELNTVLTDIMTSCIDISGRVRQGALAGVLGCAGQENVQGETQKLLDVISNDLLKDAMKACPAVRGVASEEEDHPVAANADGRYLVLYDPLDGSSNIDINVTVGTIFSILEADDCADASQDDCYFQAGNKQVSAGYVLYGPSTLLALTTGNGVNMFTLDQESGEFLLTRENVMIPADTQEFAINMSNQRFWLEPMQDYVADLLQGEEGPLGKRYNMRWVAAMVAEIHRIMTRGGIFMYPYDKRDPKKPGKLRLMYEGNPMSFLVEQAGGVAVTPYENIMDIDPKAIHERVSVVMGSANEVAVATGYHNTVEETEETEEA